LAEQASLVLDAIDYSGNSQYQVLRSMPGDKLTMYVDVNVVHYGLLYARARRSCFTHV
jgi:hypothetical protein